MSSITIRTAWANLDSGEIKLAAASDVRASESEGDLATRLMRISGPIGVRMLDIDVQLATVETAFEAPFSLEPTRQGNVHFFMRCDAVTREISCVDATEDADLLDHVLMRVLENDSTADDIRIVTLSIPGDAADNLFSVPKVRAHTRLGMDF